MLNRIRASRERLVLFGCGVLAVFCPPPVSGQAPPQWRLATPTFTAGGIDLEGDGALTALGGVTLLEDGTVVVGDRAAPYLKVFAADGTFLRATGREGSGPGEYQYVYELDWCAPGELWVFDVDGRVHRYDGDLELIATERISIEALGGGVPYQRDCHPNGLQVATGWGDHRAQFEPGLYEATAPVLLLRGQDVVMDFGERLSSQRIGSLRPDGSPAGSGPHPFGRATVVALGSRHVYLGSGEAYQIEVHEVSGADAGVLKWSGPDLDYDDDLVAQVAAAAVEAAPEGSRPRLRRSYAELPRLDQLPAFDRILVSDTDEVWVRQFPRPGTRGAEWVVFGQDGAIIGRLTLPARHTLWEVRGDLVVHSTLDDFDVPVVHVSRIVR